MQMMLQKFNSIFHFVMAATCSSKINKIVIISPSCSFVFLYVLVEESKKEINSIENNLEKICYACENFEVVKKGILKTEVIHYSIKENFVENVLVDVLQNTFHIKGTYCILLVFIL